MTSSETPQHPSERPTCISVVICNEIIEDRRSNNKTLINLFNSVMAGQFPTMHARLSILVSLTEGRGSWPISFIVRSPSDNELVRIETNATFQDPLMVLDIPVEITGMILPEPGVYFVDIMTGMYPLGHRRFNVYLAPGPPPPPPIP